MRSDIVDTTYLVLKGPTIKNAEMEIVLRDLNEQRRLGNTQNSKEGYEAHFARSFERD